MITDNETHNPLPTRALLAVIDAMGKIKGEAIQPGAGLLTRGFYDSLQEANREIELLLTSLERRNDG